MISIIWFLCFSTREADQRAKKEIQQKRHILLSNIMILLALAYMVWTFKIVSSYSTRGNRKTHRLSIYRPSSSTFSFPRHFPWDFGKNAYLAGWLIF